MKLTKTERKALRRVRVDPPMVFSRRTKTEEDALARLVALGLIVVEPHASLPAVFRITGKGNEALVMGR
jgi:hypothetical protein